MVTETISTHLLMNMSDTFFFFFFYLQLAKKVKMVLRKSNSLTQPCQMDRKFPIRNFDAKPS